MSQTKKKYEVPTLTVRNKNKNKIASGGNIEVLLDGKPMRGLTFLKFEAKPDKLVKVLMETYAAVDVETDGIEVEINQHEQNSGNNTTNARPVEDRETAKSVFDKKVAAFSKRFIERSKGSALHNGIDNDPIERVVYGYIKGGIPIEGTISHMCQGMEFYTSKEVYFIIDTSLFIKLRFDTYYIVAIKASGEVWDIRAVENTIKSLKD